MEVQNPSLPVPGYSRPKKAAAFLDVHPATMWRLVAKGIIHPPVSIGKKLSRFDNETLLQDKARIDAGEHGPSFEEQSARMRDLRQKAA